MKICSKCNIEKEESEFYKRGNSFRIDCKECCIKRQKKYNDKHVEKIKERSQKYRDSHKEERKDWIKSNREYIKKNHLIHKESYREYAKKHREERKLYINNKYRTDINYRVGIILRKRLKMAIKNNYKSGSAVKDLGCSIEELKLHLESKFYPNPETGEDMSWENHGTYGWHIDHIIPLSSFDLSNRDELLKACHYTNLQPLWAKDNLIKSNKIPTDLSNLSN